MDTNLINISLSIKDTIIVILTSMILLFVLSIFAYYKGISDTRKTIKGILNIKL